MCAVGASGVEGVDAPECCWQFANMLGHVEGSEDPSVSGRYSNGLFEFTVGSDICNTTPLLGGWIGGVSKGGSAEERSSHPCAARIEDRAEPTGSDGSGGRAVGSQGKAGGDTSNPPTSQRLSSTVCIRSLSSTMT